MQSYLRASCAALLAAAGAIVPTRAAHAQATSPTLPERPEATAAGTLTGAVRSAANGQPLSDVAIRVEGTRRGAMSDDAGRFQILDVPAGAVRVIVQRLGLATDTVNVTIPAGGTAELAVVLREEATVISPTIVSATRERQRREEASATIDVLDGLEVRRTRAAHPAMLMNRIPGVHVSELSGEGHSMAMRQPITTKPMYLYLEDGVPTRATGFFNHNALYEVNIPQSAGIEVLKGPGTALYGSDAIGGVVNVLTRPAPLTPELEANLEGGAYGYRRLLASGGFTSGSNGLRADANVTHSDNWKDRAPFDRQSGTVRWDLVGAHGWTARTVLTGSNIHQQDVPALSTAMFDTARSTNLAPIAYRRVQALRISSAVEKDAGASLWSVTPYARYNVLDLIPSWQLSYDPQIWDQKNTSLGALLKYRRDFAPLRTRVIVGTDAEVSPGHVGAQRATTTRTDGVWSSYTVGETQYDYDVTYRSVSPYIHTEFSPTSRLRIDAGLRADFSGYVYDNALTPLDTGAHRRPADTTVSYTHLSPKLGATYEWSPAVNLYASFRHGFRAPSQGQLFQQNSAANTVALKPVSVNSYEVGMRGTIASRAVYQIAAYDMTVHDDIVTFVTAQSTREATNAGRTRHRGVEGGLGVAVTPTVRIDASWAMSSQRYIEWTPRAANGTQPGVSYGGKRIEQAPRDLGNVFVAWSPSVLGGGRVALEWSHTGRYETDPANTHSYAGYDLLNLQTNAQITSRAELFARLVNVTNRRYAEIVTFDPSPFLQNQYTPGAPRMLYVGTRLSTR